MADGRNELPSTVPGSLIAVLSRALTAAARRTRAALRADHGPINGRSHRHLDATMTRFFLYAAVAPSRTPRPRDVERWTAHALALREKLNLTGLPGEPDWLDGEAARWESPSQADGARQASVLITCNGLVEIFVALDEHEGDRPTLSLAQVADVLTLLSAAIGSDAYPGCAGWRVGVRARRVDLVAAVTARRTGTEGAQSWTVLRFEQAPPPRSAQRRASMPPAGYGPPLLWSVRRSRLERRAVAVVVEQLLRANGYYALGDLPVRVADAARARAGEQRNV